MFHSSTIVVSLVRLCSYEPLDVSVIDYCGRLG
jgi:hypothetical protein